MLLQDPANVIALILTKFKAEQSTGMKCFREILHDAAVEHKSVLAAVERQMGFVVYNTGFQRFHFLRCNIGRLRDDHVEFSQIVRRRLQCIHPNAGNPAAKLQPAHILFCHRQCLG